MIGSAQPTVRKTGVDAVRAVSCLGIVATHLYLLGGYSFGRGQFEGIIDSFRALTVVFMVLSGFGITSGYLKRFQDGSIDLEGFFFRRYQKIWPFFCVTTIIGVVFEGTVQGVEEGLMELSLLYGFLPNNCNSLSVNGVCWTLGTIFAFYIFFPFISVLLKNKKRAWMAFAGSIVIMLLMGNLFLTEKFVRTPYINHTNFLFSLPFFLSGCLLSIYQEQISAYIIRHEKIMSVLCAVITATLLLTGDEYLGINVVIYKYWLLGLIWVGFSMGMNNILFTNKIIKLISKYSMEMYLSHLIIRKALGFLHLSYLLGDNIIIYLLEFLILICGTLCFSVIVDTFLKIVFKR